jgi:hypothetical protein
MRGGYELLAGEQLGEITPHEMHLHAADDQQNRDDDGNGADHRLYFQADRTRRGVQTRADVLTLGWPRIILPTAPR